MAGDDIWYKAYLTNAQTNFLLNSSNNLYVEIIKSDGGLIARRLTRLDNGLGNGDFKLSDTLSSGIYKIRAYTNWMLNFGDNFIFEKKIQIIRNDDKGLLSKDSLLASAEQSDSQSHSDTPSSGLVQFFPEGGAMISGVQSVIAFKVSGSIPTSAKKITGSIYTEAGKRISDFSTDEAGFGSLKITAEANATYYAAGTNSMGENFRIELPKALLKGFVIKIGQTSNLFELSLLTNLSTLSELGTSAFTIVVRSKGKKCLTKEFHVKNLETKLTLDGKELPEGILVITIYDYDSRPVCERLVYNQIMGPEELIIQTDKKKYNTNTPVSIEISVTNSIGKPLNGNVSLSVSDAEILNRGGNIITYLNFKSEIRGEIENPTQYFDSKQNPQLEKLDLLLLTQGWRDYLWKRLADSALRISYAPEQGITISGKVRKIWSKSPVADANVTLFAPKAQGQKLFSARTDSAGRFLMSNIVFFGYKYLNFTSRRNDGKKLGWIQIDSTHSYIPPIHAFPAVSSSFLEKNNLVELSNKNVGLKGKSSFSDTNRLAEVVIKQSRSILPTERFHINQTDHQEYSNLIQYLLYKISGTSMEARKCGLDEFSETPVLIYRGMSVSVTGSYTNGNKIDRRFTCPWDYLGQPMNKIIQVTIKRRHTINGDIPSVEVLLRPNALDAGNFANTMADLEGYYSARSFYNPLSSATGPVNNFSAATIYWQPNVVVKDGRAVVKYSHAGTSKTVQIEIEGLTDNGRPIVGQTLYTVE